MLENYTNENLVYFSTFHTHNIFRAHFLQKSFRSGVHFYSMPCSCLGWLVCGMESNIKKRSQLTMSVHSILTAEKRSPFRSVFQFLTQYISVGCNKRIFVHPTYMYFCVTQDIVRGKKFFVLIIQVSVSLDMVWQIFSIKV